jgi:hypothetical protein
MNDHALAFQEYALMRDSLNKTGRPMYFSLCGWHDWYAPQGMGLGNSWRISKDCTDWNTIWEATNTNANLSKWAGPGSETSASSFIFFHNLKCLHE